ncbi:MAG: DUF3339 domain-containing protein [Bacteroidetes bacterium]|jgi:hypothetical protein|nr:DUF3339 domain-containing protein [bacterium]NBP66468.1 DUF3339 domain-containing protein [Bacteroidota bacterium]
MLGTILLFVLLSPGVLFTIPPGTKGLFFSGETSLLATVVHAIVFTLLIYYKHEISGLREVLNLSDRIL